MHCASSNLLCPRSMRNIEKGCKQIYIGYDIPPEIKILNNMAIHHRMCLVTVSCVLDSIIHTNREKRGAKAHNLEGKLIKVLFGYTLKTENSSNDSI